MTRRSGTAFWIVFAIMLGNACSGSPPEAVDAQVDAGVDQQIDATVRDWVLHDSSPDMPGDIPTDLHGDVQELTDHNVPDHSETGPSDVGLDNADAPGPAPTVWGWISAIEWNDTCDQWYLKTQWFGGVRAHFAVAPNFNRALPHTLGFMATTETIGDCTLYDSGIMTEQCLQFQCLCLDKGVECYDEQQINRWCGEDEYCVADPGLALGEFSHGHCEPLPHHFDVGTISIQGLKQPISMTPDDFDRYLAKPADPNDLFDMGDEIVATTGGGDLPAMTFHAQGVAPMQLPDQVVTVRPDKPAKVAWTPADPNSRVQVYLAIGSHDPNPLSAAIVCDAPDAQGQVEIPYALLAKAFHLSCDGQWLMKCSRITRYTRDVQPAGTQQVELFVGSARNLQLLFE